MSVADALAVPPGADPHKLSRRLGELHDSFVSSGVLDRALRPVVSQSWRRSVRTGIDPERSLAPLRMDDATVAQIRSEHPLTAAMPVIRRLLVEDAADAGLLVAISDAAGHLLWVEGDAALRARAEAMNFVPGADWSEGSAGTNAPGTALALGKPVQIFGPEHLLRPATPWSCAAAPIREPETGAIIGVLDLTGGPEVAAPHTLSLIRAAVAAVEAELRVMLLTRRQVAPPAATALPHLEVLGRRAARLATPDRTAELSLRHSEIVLLLSRAPDGLSSAELAVELSDEDQATVTVRAELSRLRGQLGGLAMDSRPYRLAAMSSDVDDVRADLEAGRLRAAVARYRGPILPPSRAPGVVALRNDLHQRLRARLLVGDDPQALLAFLDSAAAADDVELVARALRVVPPSSPWHAQLCDRLATLHRSLS